MLVSAKLNVSCVCVCGVYRDAVGASTDSWLPMPGSKARRGLVRAGTPPSAAAAMELLGVATNSQPTHARPHTSPPVGPKTHAHTHAYTHTPPWTTLARSQPLARPFRTSKSPQSAAAVTGPRQPDWQRERHTHRLTRRPQRFLHTLCRTHPAICQGAVGPGRRQDAAAPRLH
jgi:hypothetical protein